jgi:hypothetical protein
LSEAIEINPSATFVEHLQIIEEQQQCTGDTSAGCYSAAQQQLPPLMKKESVIEPFTEAIVITPNFNYVLHGKQMAHNKSEKHHQQLVHLEGVLPNALQNRKEDGHCSILPDVL